MKNETVASRVMLPALIESGTGSIHMNAFRIYFKSPSINGPAYVRDLYEKFELYFAGNMAPMLKNSVHVKKHIGSQGNSYLQFVLNDFHGLISDDWVRVGWQDDDHGFAVETQKSLGFNSFVPFHEHFLTGRRSWIIERMSSQNTVLFQNFNKKAIDTDQSHLFSRNYIYFLETAAVERFSGKFIKFLAEHESTPIPVQITQIWSIMLINFLLANSLEVVVPAGRVFTSGPNRLLLGNVFSQRKEYDSVTEFLNDPWTATIRSLHPYLDTQNYLGISLDSHTSNNSPKFGGGSFGGGGASGRW